MAKRMIYFRGKCYEDTLRNRIVANILTFSYNILCFFRSLWILLIFVLFGCNTGSPVEKQEAVYTDSIRCDSFFYSGHTYIKFQPIVRYSLKYPLGDPFTYNSQIIHSPDCACRYNRTFIVIKRNKY